MNDNRNGFETESTDLARRGREQYLKETGEKTNTDEEFAADMAVDSSAGNRTVLEVPDEDSPVDNSIRDAARQDTEQGSRTLGWVALTLAILSLFVFPVLLGVSAVVVGIISYSRGTRALGAWAIVIGGIAVISYLVLVPYYS